MITSNPVLFTIMCVFGLQALVLSGLIAFKRPRRLANIFLALLVFFFALIVVNIVLVNVLKDQGLLYVFRYIQLEMLFGIGPSLYFYTKCISDPNFEFKRIHYLHFFPLVLEFIFYRTTFYRTGSDGLYLDVLPTYSYVYLTQQWLGVISILVYSFISLTILVKHQKQLKEYYSKIDNLTLRWLQTPIIIYASYFVLWNVITEIDRFVFDRSLREYYFLPNFVILSIATCWIGFKGYLQKERDFVFLKQFPKKTKANFVEKDKVFISRLNELMDAQKPYLNPELNLNILAELLNMKPKLVSLKINQNYSQNFYDLVNSYRVNEFKQLAKSYNFQKFSVLGLAFESGFNSKSTFNNAFKKITQLTPTQYIKKLKNKS
ncbi:helix-turn-helix domain-containing protein [Aquimarina macrocephali]|uniref:helix-turn-helix domain-containing protein n=1 Tax=Aquimarina macrocephali TaxID=666563 RepID=UPI0004B5B612|nr:helix-turn-helix domain-containing protein [Aquimarina macrocephali]